jgi:hypothetical protein
VNFFDDYTLKTQEERQQLVLRSNNVADSSPVGNRQENLESLIAQDKDGH